MPSGPQLRESTSLGGRGLPRLKCGGALQAHARSRRRRPSSRRAAPKRRSAQGLSPGRETTATAPGQRRDSRNTTLGYSAPFPPRAGSLSGLRHPPTLPIGGEDQGTWKLFCPARAALPVPLGPPLARVPCPSPFPEPRGAGAPGGAGSRRWPSPGSVSAEAAGAPGRGTGSLKREPPWGPGLAGTCSGMGARSWPRPGGT